jgi:hypothetical protein
MKKREYAHPDIFSFFMGFPSAAMKQPSGRLGKNVKPFARVRRSDHAVQEAGEGGKERPEEKYHNSGIAETQRNA